MPEVIGIDPGQTTGVVVLSVVAGALLGAKHDDDKLQNHVRIRQSFQVDCTPPWENKGVEKIVDLAVKRYPNAVIACEDFILDFAKADKARATLSPVRIIAKLEYALWHELTGYSQDKVTSIEHRINFQSASLAKTTCTDERLKEWRLYDRASGSHARDAMRHAYYFLRDCRGNSVKASEKRYTAFPTIYDDPVVRELNKPIHIRRKEPGERIEGL